MADKYSTSFPKELLSKYSYDDGALYKNNKKIGWLKVLGTKKYVGVMFNNREYYAHQIIFLLHHGYIPKVVDHIDGNGLNNVISNLRSCTQAQNCQNSKIRSDNKSGSKGVYWNSTRKKWIVDFIFNKKRKIIGQFDDLELADLVAQEARAKYHGKFARHL